MLTALNLRTQYWYQVINVDILFDEDEYEDDLEGRISFLPELNTYKQSSISNFFSLNLIDVPRCLKTTASVHKPIFNMPHLKLLHILMRHGRKEQVFASVFRTFVSNKLYWNTVIPSKPSIQWLSLIPFFINSTALHKSIYSTFLYNQLPIANLFKNIKQGYLTHPQPLNSKTFWTVSLEKYKPIFAFKVQKVDKSTRKNSRGKSGRYTTLWKYIPIYRRIYVVLRWLVQDISFQKAYNFKTRFIRALNLIENSPHKSTVVKCRNFTHNFIFKNFRKTLLQSLQTVS